MDPAAVDTLSFNEIWPKLNDSWRRKVCGALIRCRGSNADRYFQDLVRGAYSRQLKAEAETQSSATEKRKLDAVDADAADTQPAAKKPKASEVAAPLQAKGIDLASPKFPLGWPTVQQTPVKFGRPTPVKFGQPTLTAATGDTTPSAWPPCPPTSSNSSASTQGSNASLFASSTQGTSSSSSAVSNGAISHGGVPSSGASTGPNQRLFGSPATALDQGGHPSPISKVPKQELSPGFGGVAQPATPAQKATDCDEQFTFADRRCSQTPAPPAPQSQSTQHGNYAQIPPLFGNRPQGTNGAPQMSTVYKPPFSGLDMSSLKIPANSNVNVTLNVFQAPSSLCQVTDGGAPRQLKCIQCGVLYMETQNTALKCRRHSGRCVRSNDPRTYLLELLKSGTAAEGRPRAKAVAHVTTTPGEWWGKDDEWIPRYQTVCQC